MVELYKTDLERKLEEGLDLIEFPLGSRLYFGVLDPRERKDNEIISGLAGNGLEDKKLKRLNEFVTSARLFCRECKANYDGVFVKYEITPTEENIKLLNAIPSDDRVSAIDNIIREGEYYTEELSIEFNSGHVYLQIPSDSKIVDIEDHRLFGTKIEIFYGLNGKPVDIDEIVKRTMMTMTGSFGFVRIE